MKKAALLSLCFLFMYLTLTACTQQITLRPIESTLQTSEALHSASTPTTTAPLTSQDMQPSSLPFSGVPTPVDSVSSQATTPKPNNANASSSAPASSLLVNNAEYDFILKHAGSYSTIDIADELGFVESFSKSNTYIRDNVSFFSLPATAEIHWIESHIEPSGLLRASFFIPNATADDYRTIIAAISGSEGLASTVLSGAGMEYTSVQPADVELPQGQDYYSCEITLKHNHFSGVDVRLYSGEGCPDFSGNYTSIIAVHLLRTSP